VFALAVLGAAAALVGGRGTTRAGFSPRFGLAMGGWAAVLAVGLSVGMTLPGLAYDWSWWAPLAVAVAAPCLVGAWRERPR
jgi:hypothetical protein